MTAKDVDQYLAAVAPDQRAALEDLRAAIRALVPDAVEVISYQIPTFKYKGKMLVSYGAWKAHCAIYGGASGVVEAHPDAFKGYATSKGTVRFTPEKPLPAELIAQLVQARIAAIEGR